MHSRPPSPGHLPPLPRHPGPSGRPVPTPSLGPSADASSRLSAPAAQPSRRGVLVAAGGGFVAAALGGAMTPWAGASAHAATSRYRVVSADVACLWREPAGAAAGGPRVIDALAVRARPDLAGWLRRLDAQPGISCRLGLVGRLDTQLRRAEPVIVVRTRADGWTQVLAPWHPWADDPRGYRGWIAPGQLSTRAWTGATRRGVPVVTAPRRPTRFVAAARSLTGVPYLWGGTTPLGVDCSGLVLFAARAVGVQVPRDADDQLDAATRISMRRVRAGDLYFFARPGKRPHHVGIATRPGYMLNAPQTGTTVREERITGARARTLVAAGRFAGLS